MIKRIWTASVAATIVISVLPERAAAQAVAPAFRMASGPVLAAPGEHLLLCAGNLRSTAITVTLEIVNALNGAPVAGPTSITLQPLSGPIPLALPSDPCIEFSVTSPPTATTVAPVPVSGRLLYIGLVSVVGQTLLPSTICLNGNRFIGGLVASVQAFTPGTGGVPTTIRYIPVLPSDPCLPVGPIVLAGALP